MNQQATFQQQTGNAAELYEQTFVPDIAEPVSTHLMALADLQPGERVLDLACGSGIIARKAAATVAPTGSVVGVDVSADMIAVARTHTPRGGATIAWHEADAAALPLDVDSVECVLCQMGLMFVNDRDAALAEVRRVLRPGGRLALDTPGAIQPPFEIFDRALVQHVNPDLGGFVRAVFSLHDPDGIAAMLRGAGFDDVDVETRVVELRLPTPAEFLWQYIGSTPLAMFVGSAPDDARRALEEDVVDQWQEFVDDDGHLRVDQPIVYATGTSS